MDFQVTNVLKNVWIDI